MKMDKTSSLARKRTTMNVRAVLAGLTAVGLVACGSRGATDAERLARGRELVKQMSDRLASAAQASVTTTEVREVVRASGAKAPVSLTGVYTIRRPDRFYVKLTGGRGIETWYDGRRLTVAVEQEKVFAQAPMPETIDRTLDAIAERYDVALPMGDLFYSSAQKALLSDTTTGGYVGTENVGSTECHHLAFHDVGVDWEIWLPVQGEPLPKRLKIAQKRRKGEPVADMTFTAWNLAPQVSDATFVPHVPKDYEGIAMLQRAAAVKNTASGDAAAAPKQ
jgi:hypothetical protein